MCKKIAFVCVCTLALGVVVPGSAQELRPFIKENFWRIRRVAFASDAPLVRMLPVFDAGYPRSSGTPRLRAFAYNAAEEAMEWLRAD